MSRRVMLIGGLVVLAAAWLGPLPEMASRAFSAHMMLHMGVVAVAAPLVALGIAGGPFDLACHWPQLFSPIPASVVELIVVWAWHAPVLHHAATHNPAAFMGEQGMFLVTGLLVWLSVFGGDTRHVHLQRGTGLVALLLTSMHMTLLGALLALTPRSLYNHLGGFSVLTAIQDQHLGGAIMLLIGGISYLAGGLWIMAGLLREEVP